MIGSSSFSGAGSKLTRTAEISLRLRGVAGSSARWVCIGGRVGGGFGPGYMPLCNEKQDWRKAACSRLG